MKQPYNYTDNSPDAGNLHDGIFQHLEAPFGKSREEVWEALEKRIAEKPAIRVVDFRTRRIAWFAAATLLLLAGTFAVMRFYTRTVECPMGQHLSHLLPDGSSIELNASSEIAYKPYWWAFSRSLDFNGEGYFEVKKGKEFVVNSLLGKTTVLGTTFNIYSRDNEYKVTCLTGKVKVSSFNASEVILEPAQQANVGSDGKIQITEESSAGQSNGWVNNMFSFKSRDLEEVFHEIGRQYGIDIKIKFNGEYTYTGFFSRNRPVEETLALVCKPFDLTFARISENEFEVTQN